MELLCRQPPYRLAPAPRHSVSSPGVEPGPRPSQGRVRSATLREHISLQRPAEESNLVRQFRGLPCSSGTPAGRSFQCLDQDLNLDQDLRRVLCDPLHHRDVFNEHPDLESNQVQGFRKALCDPLHHRDNHRTRADDWNYTSIERFTGPPPFSIEPRRQQARARGVEPRAAGLESACSPRSTLVYRLRSRRTGGVRRHNYSFSVTFQYASLMNFDQLSIRML